MSSKMIIRSSFALDRQTRERIRSLARQYGTSQAAVIRLGIQLAEPELARLASERDKKLRAAEHLDALAVQLRVRADGLIPK